MFYRNRILLLALLFAAACVAGNSDREWRDYGKDASRSYFSPLDQIRKENVRNLRVAWVYHAGDQSDVLKSSMECNPHLGPDMSLQWPCRGGQRCRGTWRR